MALDFRNYDTGDFFDEMFAADGSVRPHAAALFEQLRDAGPGELGRCRAAAEAALLNMGITFTVYAEESGIERIFPFDLLPRIITGAEWKRVEAGLKQRITALNLFLQDVYGKQQILKDGVVPAEIVLSGENYRKECVGWRPPKDIWVQISGIDLVRDKDGEFYVLEDNLRTPSGVSYVLENRNVLKRIFPRAFHANHVAPVDDYPWKLRDMLRYLAPEGVEQPTVVVLTPGIYNSAYFEHSFLAREMGVQLVEGRDLVIVEGEVKMRTTRGFERVDVIYRRIDDDFLDPEAFRPDSMLGVPGLWEVCKKGRVSLVNTVGNGVADDKVLCAYVPRMIKYYLGEDAILPNVETYICSDAKECAHVLANLDKMVVKAANQSGGYGMLVGPHSTQEQRDIFRDRIRENPRNYIGQPTVSLSRVPTMIEDGFEGRHVDLRPYALYGEDIFVLPGGLTRVALRKGSLVVNSSQGGGSKDTWVLAEEG